MNNETVDDAESALHEYDQTWINMSSADNQVHQR
jgi:hypothetical protein